MRISDWSSDVCSSDLARLTWDSDVVHPKTPTVPLHHRSHVSAISHHKLGNFFSGSSLAVKCAADVPRSFARSDAHKNDVGKAGPRAHQIPRIENSEWRSEEHTSELQSLMRISYAVFCLKKKQTTHISLKLSINHLYTSPTQLTLTPQLIENAH